MFFTPTYKRPERLKNFIDAYIRTGATEPVEVTIQGHHELYKNILQVFNTFIHFIF